MPLGCGGCDQRKDIIIVPQAGHLCHDPPAVIGEIGKVHPPDLGQSARDALTQPFGSPRP